MTAASRVLRDPVEPLEWTRGATLVATWWRAARYQRDVLPWRAERDPWKVLVVEVMLAQTQAARVAERYPRVISRLGDVDEAAQVSTSELIELWSGLGYYRRALFLRAAAAQIVERFDGQVPDELEALLELPGVGPYTARAVLAFGFEQGVGVLDTNIGRVLARAVTGEPLSRRVAQELADRLVADRAPRDWNLALMDLGATVCSSRRPACPTCPLGRNDCCAWRASGGPDPAIRSAATSRPQTRFAGSDRQGRGSLLRAALLGPISPGDLARAAGWPDDDARASAVSVQLLNEGLLTRAQDGSLSLP